jgi:hypothetical protein
VDVNVFLEDAELPKLSAALRTLGIAVDDSRLASESANKGMSVVHFGPYRVDLFTPSIPFSREAERTRRQIQIEGHAITFLSAEAIAVFKLLFFRPKDVVDLERLIEVQRDALDVAYVRVELVKIMGEDDERVKRWDELVHASQSG